MKKIISLTVIFLIIGMSHPLMAKKKQFQGKVTYTISYEGKKMDEAQAGMMPTTMMMYLGNGFVKNVLFTGMGKQSVIFDLKKKSKTSLIDMMGQQFAIESSYEEIQKEFEREPEVEIEITDETKEIAGYNCKKIIIRVINDEGETSDEKFAWFTGDLNVSPNLNFSQKFFESVNGLLMEYQMDMGSGMMMKFTATEVEKKKIPSKDFIIPEGYKKVTREELMNSLGG